MVVAYLGGGRTNRPARPATLPAWSSSGPPAC